MLSFKKVYRDELLQIALILSLLRVNQDSIYENDILNVGNFDFDNGTSWRSSLSPSVLRSHFINPKSLDSVLLNYEREIFADLNSLGRYNRGSFRYPNVTAYLLNIERSAPLSSASEAIQNLPNAGNLVDENEVSTTENQSPNNEIAPPPIENGIELTQEEMDLIEVLWKQDVDLGFSLDRATNPAQDKQDNADESSQIIGPTTSISPIKDIDKCKDIEKNDKIKEEPENEKNDDPWAGLDYTIDTETGEYVKKEEQSDCGPTCDLPLGDLSLPIPEFLLDEALRLCELDDENSQELTLNLKELENLSLDTASADNSNSTVSDPILPQASSISDDSKSSDVDSATKEAEDELDIISNMIQTPQFHHPHHHHRAFHQSRMPFVRSVSMDQRWQDLASLLSLNGSTDGSGIHHPFSHHHSLHNYSHPHHGMGYGPDAARGVLLHNATLTPPMGDLNSTVPYSNIGGTNLGNAVATSMNLTNSSEPMGEPSASGHYKLEPPHDMMYYQQNGTELNQTDGFLSSILNDEDLQLMDMGVSDGMYGMRMLDNSSNAISNLTMNNATTNAAGMSRSEVERMDTSSDSAVSSMGSERVPSLSDGEWCDAGSDSGHTTTGEHYVTDYHHSKLRPYDYNGFTNRQLNMNSDIARIPSGAQKKHQMYGKRYFQDQGNATPTAAAAPHPTPIKYEYHRDNATASSYNTSQPESGICAKQSEMKYSCSVEFGRQNPMARSMDHIQHNHTYHLPAESSGAMQRPICRDKKPSNRGKTEEEHLTRDEKRARALNVPISVDDIINLPMDEFNERLSKYDLSEAQLSLIRDIRRRGKNKVAAQNCRKRKLDQILSLADEVKEMRDRKIQLKNDYDYVVAERKRINEKYQQLYRHVFQNLRDPDGNQYSPYQYVLQASSDGSILMVPRSTSSSSDRKDPPQGHKD